MYLSRYIINNFSLSYLTDEHVGLIEVSAEHLRRLPRYWFDLDADLHAFPGSFHCFVVVLYAADESQFHELQRNQRITWKAPRHGRMNSYLFAGHTNWSAFLHDARLDHDTHHDGVPGIEDELRQYLQFAREDGDVFEFFSFSLLQFLAVFHEAVEQMINDVGLEDLHPDTVGQFLGVSFYFDIESQNCSVSGKEMTISENDNNL